MLNGEDIKAMKDGQKETLNLLFQLATAQGEKFERTISESIRTAGTSENAKLPIESVIATEREIYVMDSVDSSKIKETVKSIVGVIAKDSNEDTASSESKAGAKPGAKEGAKKDSIADMVGNVVSGLLGASSGSNSERTKYLVYTENMCVMRLDVHVWIWEIEASSLLRKSMQRIVVLSLFKSAVDVSKLKLNTFLSLYGNQLSAQNASAQLEDAKKVFVQFQS